MKGEYAAELQGHTGIEKFLQHWEERAKASEDTWMNEKSKEVFVRLLEVQREYLVELNKDPTFDEEVIRQQLHQLDLEEERLRII